MDINMPIMNGMQATKLLRELDSKGQINLLRTKIYMHSAIQEVIEWENLFDGILNKPVNLEELMNKLSHLI